MVLISFREWLHSYYSKITRLEIVNKRCSHLFQRVASFLLKSIVRKQNIVGFGFSSLSESGFIPTESPQSVLPTLAMGVLISFREWLHSYIRQLTMVTSWHKICSHLFQRVASFLQCNQTRFHSVRLYQFSSLSESGFIPTLGFHDCLSMRLLEREKGNLRNLVLV